MKFNRILSFALSGMISLGCLSYAGMKTPEAEAASEKSRVSVHDPSIIKDGSTYYVFGSHIEAAKTTDLQNWTRFTNGYTTPNNVEFGNLSANLKKAFDWAGENLGDCVGGFAVWAPDVVWNPDYINSDGSKGAYLMYFCTSSTWNTSVIAYAASKNIEGPYTFVDTLIYSGFTANDTYAKSSTKNVNRKYTSTNIDELIAAGKVTYNNSWFDGTAYNYRVCPNAIDPTIYTTPEGKMYMVYGSWSGGIFTLEIDRATGQCIHPKTGTTSDGRMVDSYFGTKLSGGYHKSGEGPFIEYNADTGYYYLWETYGGLTSTGGYNMRVFRSKSPTGPFTDPAGRSGIMDAKSNLDSTGLKVMGNYKFSSLSKAYMACGHNSVLRDDDGQWYLFYHARFDDGAEFHEVRVHSMYFNEEGWPVVSPFEYSGEKLDESGYEESDIVGEYEFINHGNATDGNIISYTNITLNADHTISGKVTGSWYEDAGSAAAVITIGNQQYSGYFIAAENESGKRVMTFTAVGSNNQTVWGAKNTQFIGAARIGAADYTNHDAKLVIAPETVEDRSTSVKLSGTDLLSGVPYFITNKNSGLSIDLPNGKLDSGTNIQQWQVNKLWAQQWRLVAVDDEYFRIVSMGDESKCIAVAEGTAADGINVELQPYTGADNQLFSLKEAGGYYGIVSKCSGGKGALDVFEWSKADGGNINQYAYNEYACQLWKIVPVYPTVPDGDYTIKNVNSGLYLSESEGNAVQASAKTWTVKNYSDGTCTIASYDGRYLTLEADDGGNGVNMEVRELSQGSKANAFTLICNKDGSYSIMTASSDNSGCADVYEISKESGANICQWEFWNGDGQKFIFEPAAPIKKISGDVNCDGEVGAADLVMLQNYLLRRTETLPDWTLADLDNNSVIDIFDNVLLRKALLK